MKLSWTGLSATVLLHAGMYLLLTQPLSLHMTRLNHAIVVSVALPMPSPPLHNQPPSPDMHQDSHRSVSPESNSAPPITPPRSTTRLPAIPTTSEDNHYYFQNELSQPVTVIVDSSQNAQIIVVQPVTLEIYINRRGDVDDVVIDENSFPAGTLTQEQQVALRTIFKQMKFSPGLRGNKLVNALFRIQIMPIPLKVIRPY